MSVKSAKKSQLGSFNRGVPYSRARNRFYNRFGTAELVVQHEYVKTNLNAIQIALDFHSDKGTWSAPASLPGDFLVGNIQDNAPTKRYQSAAADDQFEFTFSPGTNQLNGFFPGLIYIGNHNLESGDTVKLQAYADDAYTVLGYEVPIPYRAKEIFHVNFQQYKKYPYYKLVFSLASEKILKVGRVILAGALPTSHENNMQNDFTKGFFHHKDELVTEYLSRLVNTHFFARKLDFSVQVKQDDDYRLNDRFQELIREGNGNRAFLLIPNPKNPSKDAIYGVLAEPAEFAQGQLSYGIYSFQVQEIN